MRKGVTKAWFVSTIPTLSAPSAATVNAGTRLDTSLADISGFEFSNNPIDVPDMGAAFVSKIAGEDAVSDSSMTFYEDDTTTTLQTTLAKGTTGFICLFYKGTTGALGVAASTNVCEVWPITVGSTARKYTTANEAAQFMVTFVNTAGPTAGTLAV